MGGGGGGGGIALNAEKGSGGKGPSFWEANPTTNIDLGPLVLVWHSGRLFDRFQGETSVAIHGMAKKALRGGVRWGGGGVRAP